MQVLTGIEVTGGMLGGDTSIAEPAAGEVVWLDGADYAVGDQVILTSTHRVYKCAADHTSDADTRPDLTPEKWVDIGPTMRFSPFDMYVSTKARADDEVVYEITPGHYVDAIALFGLEGVTYKVEAAGDVWVKEGSLFEDPEGWFEYLFLPQRGVDRLVFTGIPFMPNPSFRITLSAPDGVAAVGTILLGELVDLMPALTDHGAQGGVQYGATAEPVSYSYIKTEEDGSTRIVRRHSATNLRCNAVLPFQDADRAVGILHGLLDRPSAWIPSRAAGHSALTVYGLLASAPVSYDANSFVTVDFDVRGLI